MKTGWNDINKVFEAMLLKGRLDDFYEDIKSLGGWPELAASGYYPRTNLIDEGEQFVLIAELPGIKKDDLQVKVQGNYLEISGGMNRLDIPEGYSAQRTERKAIEFTRSFTLPADVDAGKVTATLNNGLLTLTLPKAEAAKPLQIDIS